MKKIKTFPQIHSEYPWTQYQEATPTAPVEKIREKLHGGNYNNMKTHIQNISNEGYLELEDGQSWEEMGYEVGDEITFRANSDIYKIIKINSNVAKIAVSAFSDSAPTGKIVVPIPAHGRHPLLRETVNRLKNQTLPIHQIILMGDEPETKEIAEETGALFTECPNQPLGFKWQHGINIAREFNPDAVLMLGSSDWISDNWCEVMMREIDRGADLIGKRKMMFVDVNETNECRLVSWNGYSRWVSWRTYEPIGAGRLFSKNILDKLGWSLFNTNAREGMDLNSLLYVVQRNGRVKMIEDPCDTIMALSLSFYHMWGNLHGFDSLCTASTMSHRI